MSERKVVYVCSAGKWLLLTVYRDLLCFLISRLKSILDFSGTLLEAAGLAVDLAGGNLRGAGVGGSSLRSGIADDEIWKKEINAL